MRIGGTKVFLPNFTIALLRTTHLPPNYAQFIVPLNINKLDLRDYLYNAYGVEVLSVRSYIEQQKIKQKRQGQTQGQWYRPQSIKKMTVELEKPFIYPEEPTDLEPWDNELYKALEEEQEQEQMKYRDDAYKRPKVDRSAIRELAQKKLAEKKMTTTTEVEKDLEMR